jgi:hypothetical protein
MMTRRKSNSSSIKKKGGKKNTSMKEAIVFILPLLVPLPVVQQYC